VVVDLARSGGVVAHAEPGLDQLLGQVQLVRYLRSHFSMILDDAAPEAETRPSAANSESAELPS
jgi:hypothetical protein